jgi:hypothetical protein
MEKRDVSDKSDTNDKSDESDERTTIPVIDSRAGFIAALRWGFTRAMREGARTRRIVCVDRDFAEWPLDAPELLAELTTWVKRPQRQLVLLAACFDDVPRRHARFVAWRRFFSTAVLPHAAPKDVAAELPGLLLDDEGTLVRLIDPVHWRGRASADARSAQPWREQIDAVLQRSEPAFPVQSLGL